ncbi:MAG: hypothetical protein DRJ01_16045 [Bacteroidetes bacterium]|nr:MAG: hypothetical protein DRJ01_16045 [Bacteroidota bacterium]
MKNPFFSIIIPTYNRAHMIGGTIQSVLNQIYDNFELIVVDDGGTDNTKDVVNKFDDDRIKYYWKENGERGAARNYGVSKSKGDYINFLDSDDLLYNNHLREACEIIRNKKNELFCFNCDIKGSKNECLSKKMNIKNKTVNKSLLKGNIISINSVFIKSELAKKHAFYEDRKFIGGEDWLLWLKLAARYPFYYFDIVTSTIIQHENRSVFCFNEESFNYRTNILVSELKKDRVFMERYGKHISSIYAHMLSYTALHASMAKERSIALRYFIKSILMYPFGFFTKRTLAIIKYVIF